MKTSNAVVCSILLFAWNQAFGQSGKLDSFVPSQHAARRLAFWDQLGLKGLPLEQRLGEAPALLVDFVRKDNLHQGFPNQPVAIPLTEDFREDVRQALLELPDKVRGLISSKVYGIFVMQDLGGSAYTDTVLSEKNAAIGAFIVLDAKVLNRRANEWATWKENSPFKQKTGVRLTAEIETTAFDNRKNALQFILLHELGHVAAINSGVHPSWNEPPGRSGPPEKFPFSALSWAMGPNSSYASIFDEAFRLRERIRYYRTGKTDVALSEAIQAYRDLEKTNFVSLYAATSPYDDFAETFANYVHSILLKKPYRIKIEKGSRTEILFTSCWGNPRCGAKKEIIRKMVE